MAEPTTIVDGRCDRCDELADMCTCPATSIAVLEFDRNPVHARLNVYVGIAGQRALAGELVLRTEEWDELHRHSQMRSGWLLLPIEVLDG